MNKLVMSGTVEQIADVLLALIAKHGDIARIIDAIKEEMSNGKKQ